MSNAKEATPGVTVTLDRPRKFKLNLSAYCELETKLGCSIFKAINWQEMGVKDVRFLLWAGLLPDDPDLTLEQVDEMIDTKALIALMPLIMGEVKASMPEAKAEAEEKKELPKA